MLLYMNVLSRIHDSDREVFSKFSWKSHWR